ncbi:hypothetical protein EIP91_002329 [Steccherinum ochraceum]|uniref:Threonine/serine exporter-like N-terminal domain-containing protein n=1 Tax=Steccherinum ochraceum TaxID=92696 RepID=A0A4R0RES0_9APHY|nr:hypothetical protein EIP91_002329 [Steccherinum ochraceum]
MSRPWNWWDWVIDAAKRWPQCTFVGYDLVNVQIPLHCLDEDIANRIQWVHGNILRQRLPYDDDEFDYIHVEGMAFAIPELKWNSVFEEMNRVLRPGGVVEVVEEDAMFPVLPRWFTGPLHAQFKRPSAHFPDGTQRSLLPSPTTSETLSHDHALLEVLFNAVFENRFLNPLPTSVLPGYFTSIFSHVISPPVFSFPIPPFAPLTPLPGELDSSSLLFNDDAEPSTLFLPDVPPEPRLSVSSITSDTPFLDTLPTLVNSDFMTASDFRNLDPQERSPSTTTQQSDNSGDSSSRPPKAQRQSVAAFMIPDMNDRIGDESVVEIIQTPQIASFEEHSLFMHLYRAVGTVLALREAMWEELSNIIKKEPDSLQIHGWDASDFKDDRSRLKFDALIDRYKGDMHVRISLWHSLTKQGWPYPLRDPLSKAELVEEERMRRAILEARKSATEEELKTPCRNSAIGPLEVPRDQAAPSRRGSTASSYFGSMSYPERASQRRRMSMGMGELEEPFDSHVTLAQSDGCVDAPPSDQEKVFDSKHVDEQPRRPSLLRRMSSYASQVSGLGEGGDGVPQTYPEKVAAARERGREVTDNNADQFAKQDFVIWLAKALLSFGAPSHRIESQLNSAADILHLHVGFVHLPNLILITFLDSDTHTNQTRFVRAGGRISLTSLHKIHLVYKDVLRDKVNARLGASRIRKVLRSGPPYSVWQRCLFAFICASIICTTAFGGSFVDMFISGAASAVLQFLGLRAASKSTIYANVYEISVAIVVSFLARALGTLHSELFCYSSISSAGVVSILPGFTILISALELTSKNILCGSVRMVYAIIYTLFLGFSLTIGSDLYLVTNKNARANMARLSNAESQIAHGALLNMNTTTPFGPLEGAFEFVNVGKGGNVIKGCYRSPHWPWYQQPFPWWSLFILVPVYSFCSSLANLQAMDSIQLPIMVLFSCLAYAANRGANELISNRGDIVSAFGALVIGLCGNVYSRVVGGTAFTSMVTGVLFLVPSAIGNGGGLIQNYSTSSAEYSSGFSLGVRMIQVAIGVTIGLFIAQIFVYALGRRKNAAHFAF